MSLGLHPPFPPVHKEDLGVSLSLATYAHFHNNPMPAMLVLASGKCSVCLLPCLWKSHQGHVVNHNYFSLLYNFLCSLESVIVFPLFCFVSCALITHWTPNSSPVVTPPKMCSYQLLLICFLPCLPWSLQSRLSSRPFSCTQPMARPVPSSPLSCFGSTLSCFPSSQFTSFWWSIIQ